jgi:hypothetical protein
LNDQLAAALASTGRSVEELARAVNRRTAALGLPPLNRTTPYKWIAGSRPRGLLPDVVAAVLTDWSGSRVTPADLGWPPTRTRPHPSEDDEPGRPWGASTARDALAETGDDMDRRTFTTQSGFALAGLANPWLLDPLDRVADSTDGRRVGAATVADIEAITAARRRMDDTVRGDSLLPAVREDLRVTTQLITRASYTAAVGRQLFAAAAEQARLASWLCFDTARHAMAQRYTLVGLRAAHAAEDRQVGANVLSFASLQAGFRGDGVAAEAFARTAIAGKRGRLTPAVESAAHARLGMARARLGDLPGAAAAFDAAETLLAASDPAAEPDWIYWFTPADLHGVVGKAYLMAGRPATAVGHLDTAVSETDATFVRDQAFWLNIAAEAQIRNGQVDEGKATAERALGLLVADLDSELAAGTFSEFCAALREKDPASARDFADQLAAAQPR